MTAEEFAARLEGVRLNRDDDGWHYGRCPAHDDHDPSLSFRNGDRTLVVKCHAGCTRQEVLTALGLTETDVSARRNGDGAGEQAEPTAPSPGLTVAALAQAKKLPEPFLRDLGVSDLQRDGRPLVRIPYRNAAGEVTAVRLRLALSGPDRFRWRAGDKASLYGLDRLQAAREAGFILIVEGESDCWTGWHRGIPSIGIPGKATWRSAWARHLEGLRVFLWVEPDATDLALRVAADLPDLQLLYAPDGTKDLSDAHAAGQDVPVLVEALKGQAVAAATLRQAQQAARLAELREQAASILAAPDPLLLVEQALARLGYGGDLRPAVVTYLATTSRLLAMREGAMPAHLLLLGVPSVGKSYTARVVLLLLPPEAYHVIAAGSPRVLIYDDADLRHRVLVFAEADSLPVGEDNPAASAVRNLAQDGFLHYKVVVKDSVTGQFVVQEIAKPGPTVLLTTAIKRLKAQMDSRLFTLELREDPQQVRAALATQARLELDGASAPDPALVAFQGLLQAQAPWNVVVPFADGLSAAIGQSLAAPRILRDFARLLSLVKAAAILRHQHRQRDDRGRLVVDLEDYRTVRELVNDVYAASATEASGGVRVVVEAVVKMYQETGATISQAQVANRLGLSRVAVKRRVKVALYHEWLLNEEPRKGLPMRLKPGEALPPEVGLPRPEQLTGDPPADDGAAANTAEPAPQDAQNMSPQGDGDLEGSPPEEKEADPTAWGLTADEDPFGFGEEAEREVRT